MFAFKLHIVKPTVPSDSSLLRLRPLDEKWRKRDTTSLVSFLNVQVNSSSLRVPPSILPSVHSSSSYSFRWRSAVTVRGQTPPWTNYHSHTEWPIQFIRKHWDCHQSFSPLVDGKNLRAFFNEPWVKVPLGFLFFFTCYKSTQAVEHQECLHESRPGGEEEKHTWAERKATSAGLPNWISRRCRKAEVFFPVYASNHHWLSSSRKWRDLYRNHINTAVSLLITACKMSSRISSRCQFDRKRSSGTLQELITWKFWLQKLADHDFLNFVTKFSNWIPDNAV